MERFVADGYKRLADSPEFKAKALEVRQTVEANYAEKLASAGPVRRWFLRIRISREIAGELDHLYPPIESLY